MPRRNIYCNGEIVIVFRYPCLRRVITGATLSFLALLFIVKNGNHGGAVQHAGSMTHFFIIFQTLWCSQRFLLPDKNAHPLAYIGINYKMASAIVDRCDFAYADWFYEALLWSHPNTKNTQTHIFKCKSACWLELLRSHAQPNQRMNDDLKCCHINLWPFYATNLVLSTSFYSCHTVRLTSAATKYEYFGCSAIHCFLEFAFSYQHLQHVTSTVLHSIATVHSSAQSNQSFGILLPVENDLFIAFVHAQMLSHFCVHLAIQSDWIGSDLHLSRFFETKNGCRWKMWTNF